MPSWWVTMINSRITPPTSASQSPSESTSSMRRVPRPPMAFGAENTAPMHEPEAADHRPADAEDRLQRAELLVGDDRPLEAVEDAREPGDRGGDRERVELHAEHADAERGGGAFVGAHRDEPLAGPRPAQVGDDQARRGRTPPRHTSAHRWGCVEASTACRTARPCRPACRRRTPSPIQSALVKTTAWIVKPRPSVTMARFTPRVRSAGSANSRPTGIGEQHAERDRELDRQVEAQDERSRDERARSRQAPTARARAGPRTR